MANFSSAPPAGSHKPAVLSSRTALKQGEQVGNYIIEGLLGAGGQADVYLARDVVLRRAVALKIVFVADGPNVHALDEARLVATLDHPNIVRVLHVQLHQGSWFMAMEHVDGTNLEARVKRVGPFSSEQAIHFAASAADALAHAHLAGVIHRDVKPQNFLISRTGVLKLVDFGLASFLHPDFPMEAPGTGTPQYMAPEIWQGEPATPQSDIYSLGATLLYMLTAAPPFPGSTVELLRKAHLGQSPRVSSEVPKPVADIIQHCLAKKPQARFASAGELQQALMGALSALRGDAGNNAPPPAAVPPVDSPRPSAYSDQSRTEAGLAVLGLPPFATAIERLQKTLAGAMPMTLVHGTKPDMIERVVRSVLESNESRVYLAARVTLTPSAPGLLQSIAQRLHLEKPSDKRMAFRVVAELEPMAGAVPKIPGLVQVTFERPPKQEDVADLLDLAQSAQGKSSRFLVISDSKAADALLLGCRSANVSALLQDVAVRPMSWDESIRYAQLWSSAATHGRARWTEDALRLFAHLEAERQGPLERLLHNSVMLSQLMELPFLTSWAVMGAALHSRYIHSMDDLLPAWRQKPATWPDDETLTSLKRLRSVTAGPLPFSKETPNNS